MLHGVLKDEINCKGEAITKQIQMIGRSVLERMNGNLTEAFDCAYKDECVVSLNTKLIGSTDIAMTCSMCEKLQHSFSCNDQRVMGISEYKVEHIQECLGQEYVTNYLKITDPTPSHPKKVIVTKVCMYPEYIQACEVASGLDKWSKSLE